MKGLLIGCDGRSRPLNPITSSNGTREREGEIKRCEGGGREVSEYLHTKLTESKNADLLCVCVCVLHLFILTEDVGAAVSCDVV